MIKVSGWSLAAAELLPISVEDKPLMAKLSFMKVQPGFPINARIQTLEFYWKVNKKKWKRLWSRDYYTLCFNDEMICVDFI